VGDKEENFILNQIKDHLKKEQYNTTNIISFGSKEVSAYYVVKDKSFINEKGTFTLEKKSKKNKVDFYIRAQHYQKFDSTKANLVIF
jgi:hypothetical protein